MDPLTYTTRQLTAAEQVDGLALFEQPPERPKDPEWLTKPHSRIERQFAEFHAGNPHVYRELERRALHHHVRGTPRIGIAKLFEDIRHDPLLETRAADFKLNNDYRALFARLLIHHLPQLSDMLAIRERREKGHTEERLSA